MRHDQALWTLAALALVLLVGALMAHGPLDPPGRIVSIDRDGNLAD